MIGAFADFIASNYRTVIAVAMVLLLCVLSARHLLKMRKKGGCSGCDRCGECRNARKCSKSGDGRSLP